MYGRFNKEKAKINITRDVATGGWGHAPPNNFFEPKSLTCYLQRSTGSRIIITSTYNWARNFALLIMNKHNIIQMISKVRPSRKFFYLDN